MRLEVHGSTIVFGLITLLFSFTPFLLAHAETKVLTAEGTYTMGEGETMTFAESMALQKAKQMALERAGTYVESYTKVQNYQLTADEIQTIAGGALQIEVLERKRELIGDGLKFSVKIKARVTTDQLSGLAQRIKDKGIAEEYKNLQEEYSRLSREAETQKQSAGKTTEGPARDSSLDKAREREQAFALARKQEVSWQMNIHKCDSRPISDACMKLLLAAGFSQAEVMKWANDKNQEAKAAAHTLLKSHGCEAKAVTASCLRNLKDAGLSDYQIGEWLNQVDVEYPGQRKTVEWLRLQEVYREGPEGLLREYKRKYSGASRRGN